MLPVSSRPCGIQGANACPSVGGRRRSSQPAQRPRARPEVHWKPDETGLAYWRFVGAGAAEAFVILVFGPSSHSTGGQLGCQRSNHRFLRISGEFEQKGAGHREQPASGFLEPCPVAWVSNQGSTLLSSRGRSDAGQALRRRVADRHKPGGGVHTQPQEVTRRGILVIILEI